MRFPVRRVLLGFAVGATAGWLAGLLRKPADAPYGSSADQATRLPQEEFGSPVEEENAAAAEFGTADDIAQEPTAPADAFADAPAEPPAEAPAETADETAAATPDETAGAAPDETAGAAPNETAGAAPNEPADAAPDAVPEETPKPRKATAPAVKRPPGSRRAKAVAAAEETPGAAEPAAGPEATATGDVEGSGPPTDAPATDAPTPKSRRRRSAEVVGVDAAAALREGHAEATQRLAGAEADATPPPDTADAATKRRRRPSGSA